MLIVEDDRDQLLVRSMLLRHNGFEVFEADSYDSGIKVASHNQVDCVVVDLFLPTEKDGLSLIRDLKTVRPLLQVLVLTGSTPRLKSPEIEMADGIFAKGTSVRLLLNRLKHLQSNL